MSVIRPFRSLRPTPELCKRVAALPYDVMTSEEAREAVKDEPYSFLHIDKAEIDLPEGTDLYSDEVYAKAKENLDKMIRNGIYIQDEKPSLYIYRLNMNGRCQTGLAACTSIDEYIEGKIKKHELTRADKEEDRVRHVDTCNANTGPIFLTYRAVREIDDIIETWKAEHRPIYDFVSEDNVGHTVWLIDEDAVINRLIMVFATVPSLYIADGHHRNASAVRVGIDRRKKAGKYDENAEFNYYLSVIFPDHDLYIMDYNRLVKDLNGRSAEEFINEVSAEFDVEEYKGEGCCKPDRMHTFGMYLEGKWYILRAKKEIIHEKDPVDCLDVSILQQRILSPLLNIGDPRTDKRIDFVGGIRGLKELVKRVDSGEMKVAFSMYPTTMSQLMDIADKGKIMPPKSTWFEPKLRSGIFIHSLE